MVSENVQDSLDGTITNYDLTNQADKAEYETYADASGATLFIKDMEASCTAPRQDRSSRTRQELEKECDLACKLLAKAYMESAEYKTLLACLDMKISVVVRWLQETRLPLDHPGWPDAIARAFQLNGFTADHKLFHRYDVTMQSWLKRQLDELHRDRSEQ